MKERAIFVSGMVCTLLGDMLTGGSVCGLAGKSLEAGMIFSLISGDLLVRLGFYLCQGLEVVGDDAKGEVKSVALVSGIFSSGMQSFISTGDWKLRGVKLDRSGGSSGVIRMSFFSLLSALSRYSVTERRLRQVVSRRSVCVSS